jgi:hypothetical protein
MKIFFVAKYVANAPKICQSACGVTIPQWKRFSLHLKSNDQKNIEIKQNIFVILSK